MLPLFESGIPLVRERLKRLDDAENITIAYPDEGAWKRFHYQFGDYPEVGFIQEPPIKLHAEPRTIDRDRNTSMPHCRSSAPKYGTGTSESYV